MARPVAARRVTIRAFSAIMDTIAYCERCETDRAYCEHGLAERPRERARPMLLISPNDMAHFPNCHTRGDDSDYRRWAELNTPDAWARLGNGGHLRATGGAHPDLIAETRCRDCVEHGPW